MLFLKATYRTRIYTPKLLVYFKWTVSNRSCKLCLNHWAHKHKDKVLFVERFAFFSNGDTSQLTKNPHILSIARPRGSQLNSIYPDLTSWMSRLSVSSVCTCQYVGFTVALLTCSQLEPLIVNTNCYLPTANRHNICSTQSTMKSYAKPKSGHSIPC